MHAAPAGFTFLPGTERPGGEVFDVAREGRVLVCKRLSARARDEGWVCERLRAEGALLRRLGGRGAPRLVDAGEDAAGPWIVMERAEGTPLAERAGAVDPAWLSRATESTAGALRAIHDAGFVHGDVSPDNVIVTGDGTCATLVDFGLARGPGMPVPPPGPFRGTLVYAAPEVARGDAPGPAADRFSLAASLLFVACGEPPRADTVEAAMLLRASEEPIEPWARRAAAHLEPAVGSALVSWCAFDARDRPDHLGTAPALP